MSGGRLMVDLGNSRLKWAWLDGEELGAALAVSHGEQPLAATLDDVWGDQDVPEEVWVSCVTSQGPALSKWVNTRWGCELVLVETGSRFGELRNGYLDPQRLGVDRWLGMIAACAAFPGQALCVVDAGTAMTLDMVDAGSQHLGGYILPGLPLMRRCLLERTGLSAAEDCPQGLGRDTGAAIALGSRNALLGLIERSVAEHRKNTGAAPLVVVTGGDAGELISDMKLSFALRPELVLEGLAEMAKRGREYSCVGS